MVLYSDRRMRLAGEEVAPIMELVRLRLQELAEAQVNLELAELLFRVLWRYQYPYWGRPSYPEPLTWSTIEGLLRKGPFSDSGDELEEAEMMSRFEEGKEDPMGTSLRAIPIHEALDEDLAKCSVCSKDVPRTLYCINCGAPIEAKKEVEPTVSDEEADAQFEAEQEAEESRLRGEAEAQAEAETREQEERAHEEEREHWSMWSEGEPEA